MIVEMRIVSLLIDPNTGLPVVVLMELDGQRAIPIVIGIAEAEAIALGLQKMVPPRPRTHDLMTNLLKSLGADVDRIVIHDLRDSTFFANIYLYVEGATLEIDARPSDAMALATRTGARIYVDDRVLEEARMRTSDETESIVNPEEQPNDDGNQPVAISPDASVEELTELLENLNPEDFGIQTLINQVSNGL